ncbi:MAG: P-II family nitrogen regulator [Gloeobacterales cyanobacterium]
MKMVVAVIQPFMFDRVVRALRGKVHIRGMTCWEVKGFGIEVSKGHKELNMADFFSPKMRMEFVVDEEMVQPVMDTIYSLCHTGQTGDGKVFVWAVDDALRIDNGETGAAAI